MLKADNRRRRISIDGREIEYRSFKRRIKHPRLEFKDGSLSVIVNGRCCSDEALIRKNKKWVLRHIDRFERIVERSGELVLRGDLEPDDFKRIAEDKLAFFSAETGVTVDGAIFRLMRSKWGSCTSEGVITLNTVLRFVPDLLIDYVVFHEVAHRIERRHNRRFRSIIREKFPEDGRIEEELSVYWYLICKNIF